MNRNNIIDIINILQFIVDYGDIEEIILQEKWIKDGFRNIAKDKEFDIINYIHINEIVEVQCYDYTNAGSTDFFFSFKKKTIKKHIRYLKLKLI